MARNKWTPNEYESALMKAIDEAMRVIPGDCELEMNHHDWHGEESRNGWYAYEYSEERGEATPIYGTDYEKYPIISDETAKKHDVNVSKCFNKMKVFVCM